MRCKSLGTKIAFDSPLCPRVHSASSFHIPKAFKTHRFRQSCKYDTAATSQRKSHCANPSLQKTRKRLELKLDLRATAKRKVKSNHGHFLKHLLSLPLRIRASVSSNRVFRYEVKTLAERTGWIVQARFVARMTVIRINDEAAGVFVGWVVVDGGLSRFGCRGKGNRGFHCGASGSIVRRS